VIVPRLFVAPPATVTLNGDAGMSSEFGALPPVCACD